MEAERDPDAAWVATLTDRPRAAAEAALAEAAADRRLFGHIARQHRSAGRRGYIEIDAPLELHAIARLLRPRHVIEVGVSSGVSSAYLLAALARNGAGELHSVDLPSHPRRPGDPDPSWALPPGRSSGWAVPPRLLPAWDLRLGDKADVVPRLARELRQVDLVVYDVPHNEADLVREFTALDPRMPAGGVAIVDHGPNGELCAALRGWARRRSSTATGRRGLGLYGMRAASRPGGPRPGAPRSRA